MKYFISFFRFISNCFFIFHVFQYFHNNTLFQSKPKQLLSTGKTNLPVLPGLFLVADLATAPADIFSFFLSMADQKNVPDTFPYTYWENYQCFHPYSKNTFIMLCFSSVELQLLHFSQLLKKKKIPLFDIIIEASSSK